MFLGEIFQKNHSRTNQTALVINCCAARPIYYVVFVLYDCVYLRNCLNRFKFMKTVAEFIARVFIVVTMSVDCLILTAELLAYPVI